MSQEQTQQGFPLDWDGGFTPVNEAIKELQKFTSPDRPGFEYVNVVSDWAWATDGHRLVLRRVDARPEQCGHYVDGLKCLDLVNKPAPGEDVFSLDYYVAQAALTLTADNVADIRNLLTFTTKSVEVTIHFHKAKDTNVCLWKSGKKTTETLEVTLTNSARYVGESDNGAKVNARYLLDAIDTVTPGPLVKVRQTHNKAPMVIQGFHGIALVMPMFV